jgi:hypothetical protein
MEMISSSFPLAAFGLCFCPTLSTTREFGKLTKKIRLTGLRTLDEENPAATCFIRLRRSNPKRFWMKHVPMKHKGELGISAVSTEHRRRFSLPTRRRRCTGRGR